MTDQSPTPVRQDLMPCIPPSGWEFFTVVDTENGVAVYRDELPGRAVVRRRVTYGDWEPVYPDRWAPEPPLDGNRGIDATPAPPQDAPHAPKDGPQRPDAATEAPDGAGGRQTGADGRETLREQYAAALRDAAIERRTDYKSMPGIGSYPLPTAITGTIDELTDAVLAVRDAELEQLRGQLARVRKVIAERRAEVAYRETEGMLPFGTPGASWCDAITVTCGRIDDALRVFPPAVGIRCEPETGEQP